MKLNKTVGQYLKHYAVGDYWRLAASSKDGIDNVVVIPALAESNHLFETLASLSRNPEADLRRTLVICVINNRDADHTSPDDIADNQKTLKILESLIRREGRGGELSDLACNDFIEEIGRSSLRLACVDASSPGYELSDRTGGVGLARKIGCDLALTLFDYERDTKRLIFFLDADTVVEENYLFAVRNCFERKSCVASVISFAHRYSENPEERAAIICYEIFLRYYVMGLAYTRSLYAFHSIGSTMACTAEGYTSVRGMNKRKAGEDFYFLNKMAKVGTIAKIDTTRVYPSARASKRVPFGTGKRVDRFLSGENDEYLLYDSTLFDVLKKWLSYMSSGDCGDTEEIMVRAGHIHPGLKVFLETQKFREIWPKLVENSRNSTGLRKNFTEWFDGFRTLKLINYLTREYMPPVDMFGALQELVKARGENIFSVVKGEGIPTVGEQERILDCLRELDR
jgi:hypothetical protein